MIKFIFLFVLLSFSLINCSLISKNNHSKQLKMPAIFSDNMVLQRDMPIPIWGWEEPNKTINVSLGKIKQSAKSDSAGKWMVKLPPFPAGGSYTLIISGKKDKVSFKNVMIGDVWICSGQSNMVFKLSETIDGNKEVSKANYPNIRLFTVNRKIAKSPQDDTGGNWSECNSLSAKDFSAVGYFFGREIYNNINVPIGLINISWGGTPIEAWMSDEVLRSDSDVLPIYSEWERKIEKYPEALEKYKIELESWKKLKKEADENGTKPPEEIIPPLGPESARQPSVLFNGLVNPVIPFGIKGVIWYQGESNFKRGYQYRKLFPLMIKDWRNRWGQGDFPFIFVQLPNYKSQYEKKYAWAEVREAQLMTLQAVENTAMAISIDIGDPDDLHPKNKKDIGKRLALGALKIAYNKDIAFSGPIYKAMIALNGKIKLEFEHTGGGLISKNNEPLKGFEIAGEDKIFVKANAVIEGNSVIVWSDEIKKPKAVRYGWESAPEVNLYNKANLPASPFRTDNWKGDSEGYNIP